MIEFNGAGFNAFTPLVELCRKRRWFLAGRSTSILGSYDAARNFLASCERVYIREESGASRFVCRDALSKEDQAFIDRADAFFPRAQPLTSDGIDWLGLKTESACALFLERFDSSFDGDIRRIRDVKSRLEKLISALPENVTFAVNSLFDLTLGSSFARGAALERLRFWQNDDPVAQLILSQILFWEMDAASDAPNRADESERLLNLAARKFSLAVLLAADRLFWKTKTNLLDKENANSSADETEERETASFRDYKIGDPNKFCLDSEKARKIIMRARYELSPGDEETLKNEREAVRLYRVAASLGLPSAQYRYGTRARFVAGSTDGRDETTLWTTRACALGVPKNGEQVDRDELVRCKRKLERLNTFKEFLDSGRDAQNERAKADALRAWADASGDPVALIALALRSLFDGQSTRASSSPREDLRRAMKAGSLSACRYFAIATFDGSDDKRNAREAFGALQKLANSNDRYVNLLIALCYRFGVGTFRNNSRAGVILSELSDQGYAPAIPFFNDWKTDRLMNGASETANSEDPFAAFSAVYSDDRVAFSWDWRFDVEQTLVLFSRFNVPNDVDDKNCKRTLLAREAYEEQNALVVNYDYNSPLWLKLYPIRISSDGKTSYLTPLTVSTEPRYMDYKIVTPGEKTGWDWKSWFKRKSKASDAKDDDVKLVVSSRDEKATPPMILVAGAGRPPLNRDDGEIIATIDADEDGVVELPLRRFLRKTGDFYVKLFCADPQKRYAYYFLDPQDSELRLPNL